MIEWISNSIAVAPPVSAGFIGMILTWVMLPIIISVSHAKKLFDEPTGIRKIHSKLTPNLGGVAFYFSILTVFLISGYALETWSPYLIAGLTILFFSGVKDDIFILSPKTKLAFQILAISTLLFGGDLVITNLGGVFGFEQIPYWAGMPLTLFTMIVVVNAYNLIDGIDGLAGSIGLMVTLFFGAWFWYIGQMPQAVLALICAGSLLSFLWYNFNPASIFMGDTGSQVMGFMLAFFAVSFVKVGLNASIPSNIPFQNEIPILVLAVLIVPLYDTLRVFTLRLFRNGSPFKADRLHIHHQLLDFGFSDKATCFIIAGLNIFIVSLTLFLGDLNVNILFGIVLLASGILFPTTGLKRYLLNKAGVVLPSARHIRILERKYGFDSDLIRREVTSKDAEEKNDWDKVAV